MRIKVLTFIILLFPVVFLESCEDEPCDKNLDSFVGIDFLTINEESATEDSSLSYLSLYAISRPDSLLYDSTQNVTGILLPLSPKSDQSTFVFMIDSLNDTLEFRYNRDFKLVSQDCGFQSVFEIESVSSTNHQIDFLSVINTNVQSSDATHLEIYLY